MPTYDYICTGCGHEMEVKHSVHDDGPAACPVCGAPMKKAFSLPSIHFKGSGWARKESSAGRPARTGSRESDQAAADSGAPAAAAKSESDSGESHVSAGGSGGGSSGGSSESSGSNESTGSPGATRRSSESSSQPNKSGESSGRTRGSSGSIAKDSD